MLLNIAPVCAAEFGLVRRWPALRWPLLAYCFLALAAMILWLTGYAPVMKGPFWLGMLISMFGLAIALITVIHNRMQNKPTLTPQ